MVGRQTIERWPFDGSSVAGAAVATVATAEYVSGEPERAIALAESTLSALASPSLAAVTLRRVLGQARRAVGDVHGRARRVHRRRRDGQSSWTCRRWRSSSTSHTPRCRPTTDTSRRRCRRCARASRSRSASGRSINEAWARSCLGWVLLRVDPASALEEIERALESSRRMTTTGSDRLSHRRRGQPPITGVRRAAPRRRRRGARHHRRALGRRPRTRRDLPRPPRHRRRGRARPSDR